MFPMTRTSAISDLLSGDPARATHSLEVIAAAYWRPSCAYLRARWGASPQQAEDLVQSFFETVLRRDVLASYQPTRGRFRTFLRACLDRHAIDQHRFAVAARRGGGARSLDLDDVPVAAGTLSPEAMFDAEWLRHLMQLAIERLDAHFTDAGKPVHAALFRTFLIDDSPPSYAEAAATHSISVSDVNNRLHAARKQFRRIALELLRELTIDDAEFAAEAKAVFNIDV